MFCNVRVVDSVDVLGARLRAENGEDPRPAADVEHDFVLEKVLVHQNRVAVGARSKGWESGAALPGVVFEHLLVDAVMSVGVEVVVLVLDVELGEELLRVLEALRDVEALLRRLLHFLLAQLLRQPLSLVPVVPRVREPLPAVLVVLVVAPVPGVSPLAPVVVELNLLLSILHHSLRFFFHLRF